MLHVLVHRFGLHCCPFSPIASVPIHLFRRVHIQRPFSVISDAFGLVDIRFSIVYGLVLANGLTATS